MADPVDASADLPEAIRRRKRLELGVTCFGVVVAVGADLASRALGPNDAPSLFGRLHPVVVHLPLGVAAFAVLAAAAAALRPAAVPAAARLVRPAIAFAFASAVLAVVLGALLAREGGVPAGGLAAHRTLALAATVLLAAAVLAPSFVGPRPSRLLVLLAAGALGAAGHFGGALTHGDDYLRAPWAALLGDRAGHAPADAGAPAAAPDGGAETVYAAAVAPLLARRCGRCHGDAKQKGGLRVDSLEALVRGGKHGPAVVAGHAEVSPLVARARLPEGDDGHMPPEGEPGFAPGELEALALWIDRGASVTLRLADVLVPAPAASWLGQVASAPSSSSSSSSPAAADAGADDPRDAGGPPLADAGSATPGDASTPRAGVTSAGPTASPPAAGPLAYRDRVAPILAAKCGKCHGATKAQGKLRTDSLAALLRGGVSGPAVVRSAPAKGELLARVRLPASDEDHMPPEGKGAPLSAAEIRLVEAWIARGASADLPASALP